MNWLSSFYLKHPEYRNLRVVKKTPTSIHFELEPGLYEAHFQIKPIFDRVASGLWLPAGQFAALGRIIGASIRNPRLAAEVVMTLPFATTLTLQPDATAGLDTYIRAANPNTNYGTGAFLWIGNRADTAESYRSLIKFSLVSLPDSAVISAATLSLWAYEDQSSNARTFRVYRQKRAWTETGATWNKYDGTNAWQAAGGFGTLDCEQTDIGTRNFTATETLNQFKNFVLTPTTKAGLDLGNGWLIKADTESADAYNFRSSDYVVDTSQRPELVVEYTLPAGGAAFNAPFAGPFRGPFG